MNAPRRPKALIFVVAYNAENTIREVIDRIPPSLARHFDMALLVIDDCSQDGTHALARGRLAEGYWCPSAVLRNPVNQGYGGNQKLGYRYAMANGFDVVALLHGDAQYAPECLPDLLRPFLERPGLGAVFGSRMLESGGALAGGMPRYKYIGNKVLTALQNRLLGSSLSEFHTGYRVYSVRALSRVPFHLNADGFSFDTEIIVQLFFSGAEVVELPIPTHYGNEVCHVEGVRYAREVVRASLKARLMRMGIFFDPKFAVSHPASATYVSKLDFFSTHSVCADQVKPGSVVLDLGCADGYLSEQLHRHKGCEVYSVDARPGRVIDGCHYLACDLDNGLPDVPWDRLDVILLLDVVEHLSDPEAFLERLREKLSGNHKVRIILSSGNVCFFVTRLMMLAGQFNYGERGILDITHRRLFTVRSLERLICYAAYHVESRFYIPAPYPLAIGLSRLSRLLLALNRGLARLLPGLFAYQSLYVARARPGVAWLLGQAVAGRMGEENEVA